MLEPRMKEYRNPATLNGLPAARAQARSLGCRSPGAGGDYRELREQWTDFKKFNKAKALPNHPTVGSKNRFISLLPLSRILQKPPAKSLSAVSLLRWESGERPHRERGSLVLSLPSPKAALPLARGSNSIVVLWALTPRRRPPLSLSGAE